MDLIPLDDARRIFLSPDIDDWPLLAAEGVRAVIDVDGGIDVGIPTVPNQTMYLYFPFNDAELPDAAALHAVAGFGADLIRGGWKVLVHCGLGYNRSALVAALILMALGQTGAEAVEQIRRHRPGALYNSAFAAYLLGDSPAAGG